MKNKKIILIAVTVLLCTALIAGVICICAKKQNKSIKDGNTDNSDIKISAEIKPIDGETESIKTEITDSGNGLKPDETEADEILKKAEERAETVYTEPVLQPEKREEKKYVKDADPETGISWDGESKIIYRTAEGQTTEKTYGGYYEIRPNEWVQLPYPVEKEEITDKCVHCGKIRGDGLNGTCIRYSLADGDMTCPNCGKTIPKHTCHTCGG